MSSTHVPALLSTVGRTILFKARSGRSILVRTAETFRTEGAAAAAARLADFGARLLRWYSPSRIRRRNRPSDFDRRFGVDTSGCVHPSQLGDGESDFGSAQYYKGVPEEDFSAAMAAHRIDPSDYVFIDYGSGKGKAMFLASLHPFRRIIGVELSRDLHQTAIKNIETFRHPEQRCFDIESLHENAVTYEPPSEPCVFFLYNPFDYSVLGKVLDKLDESHRRNPRQMRIIYLFPREHEKVAARPGVITDHHSTQFALYRLQGASS